MASSGEVRTDSEKKKSQCSLDTMYDNKTESTLSANDISHFSSESYGGGKKSRIETKSQRKSMDSYLADRDNNFQTTSSNRSGNIDVSHILGTGTGTAGSGLDLETKSKTKRAKRHTLGSTPLRPLAEEETHSCLKQKFLPDIASSMKKKNPEKAKPIAMSIPYELLDIRVIEKDKMASPNIRRQNSDHVALPGTIRTVGGGPSVPTAPTLLDRKNRTDSFVTYTSTKTAVSSFIPKVLLTQSTESSKAASSSVQSAKSSKSSSSSSSILLRLRMGGGTIIAGPLAKDAIEGLGLQQKELKILKDTFDKIDDEKEGCVTSEKLYTVLEKKGYHQNSFSTKVYQLIDMEGNGFGFGEFVRLSATFLMFTPSDLPRFVFQCYNKKGLGMFGIQDFSDLTADINTVVMGGGPRKWSDVLKYDHYHETLHNTTMGVVEEIPKKGYLTEEEFLKMSADYPSLFCFATKLQSMLQELCLGERFYKKLLHRQERARAIEEYKATHFGELPKEEFSMNAWFRKIAYIASIDDEPDLTKRDNSKLLELGFGLYTKLQKMRHYNQNNHIPLH